MNIVRRVSTFFSGGSSKPDIGDPKLISVNDKPVPPGPPPPPPPPPHAVNVKITKMTPNSSSKKSRQSVVSPPVSRKSVNSTVSNDNDSDISDLSDEEYGVPSSSKSRNQSIRKSSVQGSVSPIKSPSTRLSVQSKMVVPPPPPKSPNTIHEQIGQQIPFSSSKSRPPLAPSNENTLEFIHLIAFRGDTHTMRQLLVDFPDAINKRYDYLNSTHKKLLTPDEINDASYRPPPPLPALVRNALQLPASQLKLDDRWILSEFFGSSTIMHYACAGNQLPMVQLLLAFGSESHALNKVGREPDYYTSLDTIQNLLGNQQAGDVHVQNEMSNVPFANVKDNIVEKEEPAIEEVVVATSGVVVATSGVVVAPSGGSLHEEFMKSALAEADSYVEAWEQKESQVYSIDQTIDSNVYAESFIVREKVPETKQTDIEKVENQIRIKKLAEVVFPEGSSLKKVVDGLAPLKFPQAKEFMTSEDAASGKVVYIQYKPEMDLVNDRINTVNNRNSTALNRSAGPVNTTTPSTNRDSMLSKAGNTRGKASKVLIHDSLLSHVLTQPHSKNKIQNPNHFLWNGVANSLKEDSSFRAVRLDALNYGQKLLSKEFKNLGLTDNWEGLQVGVSQSDSVAPAISDHNLESNDDTGIDSD